jgi:hypothetical protein
VGQWAVWAAGTSGLFITWLIIAVAIGGGGWFPWFLLIAIPWAIAIARRS